MTIPGCIVCGNPPVFLHGMCATCAGASDIAKQKGKRDAEKKRAIDRAIIARAEHLGVSLAPQRCENGYLATCGGTGCVAGNNCQGCERDLREDCENRS